MGDLLDKLGKEKEQEDKKLKLSENKALVELVNGFEKAIKKNNSFDDCVEIINKFSISYSPRDIYGFSFFLNRYSNENHVSDMSGFYISALIQQCDFKIYKINTNPIGFKIDFLGYSLDEDKKLKIIGDVGLCLGDSSSGKIILKGNAGGFVGYDQEGKIIIYGNVGDRAGHNQKGKIIIHGDAADYLGVEMYHGLIIVHGNVGDYCGTHMADSKIKIYGNIGDHLGDEMVSGEIFVEGSLRSISESIDISEIIEDPDICIIKKRGHHYYESSFTELG